MTRNYWTDSRRFGRRRFVAGSATGIAGLSALALTGCGGDDKGTSGTSTEVLQGTPTPVVGTPTVVTNLKRGGKLRATATLGPSGLDPQTGQSGGDHHYFWTLFNNLIAYNRRGEPDGALSLAQSWELPDPTTLRLKIRPGVTFHDGTKFDAESVKWNIQRVLNPDTKSSARGQLLAITSVEAPDASTVVLKLDKPNGALLVNLGDRGGAMVSRAAAEKFGQDFTRNPVGTGPFQFDSWVQDSVVRVKKNPNYWRKGVDGQSLPYFDELLWQLIPETVVQVANFERGDLDTIPLAATDYDRIKANSKFAITNFAGAAWSGLYFNRTLDPVKDPRVREAIAYAVDRNAMVQAVTFGRSPVALGPITPAQWPYDKTLKAPSLDKKRAKDLFSAAGMDGKSLPIISYPPVRQSVELFQAMLKEVGVNVEPTMVEVGTMTQRMWNTQDMPVCLAGFSIRADPDGMMSELYHSKGFYNAGHPDHPTMDGLVEKARQSYDIKERTNLYTQVQRLGLDENFGVYFYYSLNTQASVANLKGAENIFGAEGKQRYDELFFA
jgi:ABC-type transport system substrate-binding protein